MSKTCPRCGSEFHPVTGRINTLQLHVGNWNPDNESEFCLIRQRDQLRAQLETLKAERNAAGMRERNGMLALVEKWKAYAERLEEAGDKLCAAFGKEWLTDGDIEAIQDDWEKAKESNP